MTKTAKILRHYERNPNLTYGHIAKRVGCMEEYVRAVFYRHNLRSNSAKLKAAQQAITALNNYAQNGAWADAATSPTRAVQTFYDLTRAAQGAIA